MKRVVVNSPEGGYRLLLAVHKQAVCEEVLWNKGIKKGLQCPPLAEWEESKAKGILDNFNSFCEMTIQEGRR